MSLICPACSASYNIPAEVLGPHGRKVSCPKCGHVWHATTAVAAETARAEKPQPELASIDISKFNTAPPAPEIDPAEERRERIKAAQLTPLKLPEPDPVWLMLFKQFFPQASLAVLAIILGLVLALRVEITQKAPSMVAFYNFIGLSALPPGGGVSIVNVRDESRFGTVDNALILRGQLVNHTPTTLKVPLFKLEFTSPQGQTKTFMARNPIEKIEPGAMVPFTLERAGFAQLGWKVKVTFGDGTEGEDTGKAMQTAEPVKH